MTTINDPDFVPRDPLIIEQEVMQTWLDLTSIALTPNQPEWMLLKTIAYRETLCRIQIQEAAKLNLVRYSRYPMTDHLGALVGANRLDARAAVTTLRLSIEEVLGEDKFIAEGTRWKSADSLAVFATDADATIPEGELFVDVTATCTTAGAHGNGYHAGQISTPFDTVPGVSAENLTTTQGGSPAENDPRYVERVLLGPDGFSTAGSEQSYRFHALSASPAIEDVAVISAEPMQIRIVLLDDDGSITPNILDLVANALTPEEVRPQTDTVTVDFSYVDDWQVEAELTIYKNAVPTATLAAAQAAADAYVLSRRKLGRAALREQIRAKLAVRGVHSVNLIEPATDVLPAPDSWARCTSVAISIGDVSEETSDD